MYSNWSYSPETPNLGQIRRFLEPCDLEIWRMTLKNNRAPLLCCFQLCAWFHCHIWIQTGVRVRKRLSWVLTSVTLTFDLWPWPFAWTSLWTMVITPDNFMMIRWWEHGEKGVTDGWTDRRTDGLNQSYSCLVAAKNGNRPQTLAKFLLILMPLLGEDYGDSELMKSEYINHCLFDPFDEIFLPVYSVILPKIYHNEACLAFHVEVYFHWIHICMCN